VDLEWEIRGFPLGLSAPKLFSEREGGSG